MLNNYVPGKDLFIALLLVTFLCTSSVVKAEENFEAMAKMVNFMDSFFGLMNSIYDMNADSEKAALL